MENFNSSQTLEALKDQVRSFLTPQVSFFQGRSSFSYSAFPPGIPQGTLTEWSSPLGGGKTEAILAFLKEHPDEPVIWIEEGFSFYPPALWARGVGPMRRNLPLFVQVQKGDPQGLIRVALDALRSQVWRVIILVPRQHLEERALRQLQVAVRATAFSVCLLSSSPQVQGSWPIALQLGIIRNPSGRIAVNCLKARSGWGDASVRECVY
jgi:hypothetical protein